MDGGEGGDLNELLESYGLCGREEGGLNELLGSLWVGWRRRRRFE